MNDSGRMDAAWVFEVEHVNAKAPQYPTAEERARRLPAMSPPPPPKKQEPNVTSRNVRLALEAAEKYRQNHEQRLGTTTLTLELIEWL